LKLSVAQGFSPKAFQIREMVGWLIPVALAMSLVDQWVASLGFSVRVLTTTASMTSSANLRGTPGRGSSVRAAMPPAMYRPRHLRTVA
jgi:hypothetical protein